MYLIRFGFFSFGTCFNYKFFLSTFRTLHWRGANCKLSKMHVMRKKSSFFVTTVFTNPPVGVHVHGQPPFSYLICCTLAHTTYKAGICKQLSTNTLKAFCYLIQYSYVVSKEARGDSKSFLL